MTYISIRQILDDLLDDPLMKELSLERAVNYAVEFIKIVGMPSVFINKEVTLDIKNYRAQLPCDFYEMVQVCGKDGIAYTYASDSFGVNVPYTYKIQGSFIYTSKETDSINVAYRAFKQDEDGFPLIVDNGTFPRALELYIQKRWFTRLFNSGKVAPAVLQNVQQEYAFTVGQAQSDLIRPTIDQMQSITNMWTSLLPRVKAHHNTFTNLTTPELLKH